MVAMRRSAGLIVMTEVMIASTATNASRQIIAKSTRRSFFIWTPGPGYTEIFRHLDWSISA